MTFPKVAMLVNGGASSIEMVRARGLASQWPEDRKLFLTRDGSRWTVAARWHAALKRWKPDVAYVLNTALPGAVLGPWWSRRAGKPFILDTGDAVLEMAARSGVTPAWKRPALRRVENLAQRSAAIVVVRGTRHQEHLRGLGLRRVEVIRDGYMPAPPADPDRLAALRRQWGLGDGLVVGVMGSLVFSPRLKICYGWDLVEALALLRDLPIRGLVIGDGDGREWLENKAEALGVRDRIAFTGRVPYADVPLYLQLMDIALSTQTNNLPGQVRTTGKLPEYMAVARMILASRVGEAAILLPEIMLLDYEGEVDPAYPGRLAARIRELAQSPGLMDARLELPALAARHCSYETLSARFAEVARAAIELDATSASGHGEEAG
jgi:glycosyltransferase involved in cell wall biosynthesis